MSQVAIILIIALILSAICSGIEISFVSADKMRFEMEYERKTISSVMLARFFRNPNNFISTMLVANNIALVVYSTMMARFIEEFLPYYMLNHEFLLVFIETLISTAIIIVFGEFLPKTLFRINANASLNFFSFFIFMAYILLYPISSLTTWLSKIVLKIAGVKIGKENSVKAFSKVELDYFIHSVHNNNKDNIRQQGSELKIFQNVLDFSNVKIRDCMIPRNEIQAVDISVSLDTLKELFIQTGLSKIVVFQDDIDHIIGYIHSSELFRHKEDWRDHIRSTPFVPETLMAHKLMKQLQSKKKTLAVVIDEFGGTSGIVSLEDLVEEILGEIEDEHDINSLIAKKTDNGYLLSGRMEIEHVNELFDLHIMDSEEYITIGGLILEHAKGFPKVNESIEIGEYSFKILKMSDTKIELVMLFTKN